MRVTLLGTGTPGPNPDRRQASVLVETGSSLILVDCGRGTLQQLARLGIDAGTLDRVLVTHLHLDHIAEVYDVVMMSAMCGRTAPFRVWGPRGTRHAIDGFASAYAADVASRGNPPAIRAIETVEIAPGVVIDTPALRVITRDVMHAAETDDVDWHCVGYRLEAAGRVVAISGDTVPCDGIVELAQDADLLIQCCHFPDAALVDDAVRAMTERTLPSAAQAGAIARDANVRHIVLTHISMQVTDTAELARDVERVYDGTVTVGEDLMVIDV